MKDIMDQDINDTNADDYLIEHQFTDYSTMTKEDIIQRLTACGGIVRTVSGKKRVYVYRIICDIAGYNKDARTLIGEPITKEQAEEFENIAAQVYFDPDKEKFIGPRPDSASLIELVDDTLKITRDLETIRKRDNPGPKKSTIIQARYDSTHCVKKVLKLNRKTDASILAKLASVPSIQGYIKELILQDIRYDSPELLKLEYYDGK